MQKHILFHKSTSDWKELHLNQVDKCCFLLMFVIYFPV